MTPEGSHIAVRGRGRLRMVRVDRILWVRAAGGMSELHLDEGGPIRVSPGLGGMEERLSPFGFVRIHRSTLVNLRGVGELRHKGSGNYVVTLRDGCHLDLSRNRRAEVLRRLGAL